MKQAHRITGIIVAIFIIAHLFNHLMAWFGIATHQTILEALRSIYRIFIIEIILIASFLFQAMSGILLFFKLRKKASKSSYEKLQMWSGLIIGLFILQHIPATLGQRWLQDMDTNFYFAASVVKGTPLAFYFAPYYFLGITSVGIHIANVHRHKITSRIGTKAANIHFYTIITLFSLAAIMILIVFMGGYYDFDIPES